MKDTLYIVMPAYNEEANIEKVVEAWYRILEGKAQDSRLVVVTPIIHMPFYAL